MQISLNVVQQEDPTKYMYMDAQPLTTRDIYKQLTVLFMMSYMYLVKGHSHGCMHSMTSQFTR